MKRLFSILILSVFAQIIFAQNQNRSDQRTQTQNVFIKLDGNNQTGWNRDNDNSNTLNAPVNGTENVNFNTTSEGIYITIIKGTNEIKLYALTGQLLLDGNLAQGRFFIPAVKGIYFLRINNKSFKAVCK